MHAKITIGNSLGIGPLERHRRRREYNIKIDLRVTECDAMYHIKWPRAGLTACSYEH